MTEKQQYLGELISEWRNNEIEKIGGPYGRKFSAVISKPKQVEYAQRETRKLHRIIQAWERKASTAHKKATKRINRLAQEAREKVIFDSPERALKFVKKLIGSTGSK